MQNRPWLSKIIDLEIGHNISRLIYYQFKLRMNYIGFKPHVNVELICHMLFILLERQILGHLKELRQSLMTF